MALAASIHPKGRRRNGKNFFARKVYRPAHDDEKGRKERGKERSEGKAFLCLPGVGMSRGKKYQQMKLILEMGLANIELRVNLKTAKLSVSPLSSTCTVSLSSGTIHTTFFGGCPLYFFFSAAGA